MSHQQATRVLAIRHGETSWNVDTRIQGKLDIGLNDNGRKQAERLGAALAKSQAQEPLNVISAIYSSDLWRAYDTALSISKATGVPVVADEGLRERGFGVFEGKTFDEIAQLWPDQSLRWRQRDPHFGDALLRETFGVPPTDNVIRKWRVNGDARTAGEFLPKCVDVIAQRFVRSGRRVGRFVFEAGDRECRRAWLCDIWLFLLGFGGFWFSRGRFCRAWLFCFWLSRSLFFGAWLIRVGGHRDARDRGRKAQATNQAACDVKTERSLSGHDICHSFIS